MQLILKLGTMFKKESKNYSFRAIERLTTVRTEWMQTGYPCYLSFGYLQLVIMNFVVNIMS